MVFVSNMVFCAISISMRTQNACSRSYGLRICPYRVYGDYKSPQSDPGATHFESAWHLDYVYFKLSTWIE